MRIGYLIIAHHLPGHLVRLVERLDAPDTTFFIHFDATGSSEDHDEVVRHLGRRANVRLVARHPCSWAGLGVVRGTLECMMAAVEDPAPPDYLILLSGQDYPVTSHSHLLRELEEHAGEVIMQLFPLPHPKWLRGEGGWGFGGMTRFQLWWVRFAERPYPLPYDPYAEQGLAGRWSRLMQRFGPVRRFPGSLQPYGGSAFWVMPLECARHVVALTRSNPAFTRFFRFVFCPDEMFFHTLIGNSDWRNRVVRDGLHYMRWPRRDEGLDMSHPLLLTIDHLDQIIASGQPFARKFDPRVDTGVLDALNAHSRRVSADG